MKVLQGFKKNTWIFVGFLIAAIPIKWMLINYGLPYQTHVDELAILKEPFKLLLEYKSLNFTTSTNLLNWIFLLYSGIVYAVGLLIGSWTTLDGFKDFVISDSGNLLLIGRLFFLITSLGGGLLLIKLVLKLTTDYLFKVLFALIVLFNPIEWNSTNWIKFEGISYLMYAIILNLAHDYFTLNQDKKRIWLYLFAFLGVSLRIEIIAYLAGIIIYDFFIKKKNIPFSRKLGLFYAPLSLGLLIYFVVTLAPASWISTLVYKHEIKDQTINPTFEQAIASKLPVNESLINSFLSSVEYLKILLALLGPILIAGFLFALRNKSIRYIYLPFLITVLVLVVFPVKNTHYLLNVSLLIVVGALSYFAVIKNRRLQLALLVCSLLWTGSYSFNFLRLIGKGDVRILARDYLMKKTQPSDSLLVEGIFSQISDTPERYLLRSEAAVQVGSTGESARYIASHLNKNDTRTILQITDYSPFKGTVFENTFSLPYDSSKVQSLHAKFFVYVPSSQNQIEFSNHPKYKQSKSFFNFIARSSCLDRVFNYNMTDPRLKYSNYYYFHPVLIYKLNCRTSK